MRFIQEGKALWTCRSPFTSGFAAFKNTWRYTYIWYHIGLHEALDLNSALNLAMSINTRDPTDYVSKLLISLMKKEEIAFEMLFLYKNK